MSKIEAKIAAMGLVLPPPLKAPEGVVLPFAMVVVHGDRAIVSGHGPQNDDGTVAGPFGKIGGDISVAEGRELASKTALSILSSLQRELGDLDRIAGWGRVFGMVNCTPDFELTPMVINGFSDLILELFGPDVGRHARSAVGMAALPFSIGVEIEADVFIRN